MAIETFVSFPRRALGMAGIKWKYLNEVPLEADKYDALEWISKRVGLPADVIASQLLSEAILIRYRSLKDSEKRVESASLDPKKGGQTGRVTRHPP